MNDNNNSENDNSLRRVRTYPVDHFYPLYKIIQRPGASPNNRKTCFKSYKK